MNTKYKHSLYNIFIEYKADYLLFNAFTSALLLIKKHQIENIKKLLLQPDVYSDMAVFKTLSENGFIVNDNFDERKIILNNYCKKKERVEDLFMQIVVNTACNFDCEYCFEKKDNKYMQDNSLYALNKYLHSKMSEYKSANVTWVGGEPLLSWDTIKFLSNTLLKFPEYNAFMFTNGYLFNDDIINDLLNLHINKLQITIDGDADIHNKRRNSKHPVDSYGKILSNIEKIISKYDKQVKITVSSNLDNDNYASYPTLLENLSHLKDDINLGIIRTIYNDKNKEKEMPFEKFDKFKREMHLLANEMGFIKGVDLTPKKLDYPACFAELKDYFLIDPGASVYKCILEIENNNNFGFLNETGELIAVKEKEYYFWKNYSIDKIEKCNNCEYFPLCLGGCPREKQSLEHCESHKSYISNRVITSYELSKNEID
jgi:uncharacterized protein